MFEPINYKITFIIMNVLRQQNSSSKYNERWRKKKGLSKYLSNW